VQSTEYQAPRIVPSTEHRAPGTEELEYTKYQALSTEVGNVYCNVSTIRH
jgi:hypothetical protein